MFIQLSIKNNGHWLITNLSNYKYLHIWHYFWWNHRKTDAQDQNNLHKFQFGFIAIWKKAFDTVNHRILLTTLEHKGVRNA